MSLLGFEVTPAHFTFLALFHYLIYIMMNFQRVLLSFSLEMILFSKAYLSFLLLRIHMLHCLFASIEEI